jgi:hypothetical protein
MPVRLATVGTSFPKKPYRFCDRTMPRIKKFTLSGSSSFARSMFSKSVSFAEFFLSPHIENCGTSPLRHKTA